ncbi:hypothetical protein HK100_005411 [Physocladia obscura]|uniref:Uncharacterized protein n=1 Tax=Physocladia obscura TaxID=109957 RepID=A0AAD5XGG1_9FUNG|nr:hypothetical protein HK100_005411 [Physocladia obscura]
MDTDKPFDKIQVRDETSQVGRILVRLRGYTPSIEERALLEDATRSMTWMIALGMTVGGMGGSAAARVLLTRSSGLNAPFGLARVVGGATGALAGCGVGATVAALGAARKLKALPDSFIARVVREEAAAFSSSSPSVATANGNRVAPFSTASIDSRFAQSASPRKYNKYGDLVSDEEN